MAKAVDCSCLMELDMELAAEAFRGAAGASEMLADLLDRRNRSTHM